MNNRFGWCWLIVGVTLGGVTMYMRDMAPKQALAGNDRHEDYIMCTGQIQLAPNVFTDTVWMLDYRAGKLLGTIVDRNTNRLLPWREVDLVKEFNIAPKQNVHFMMTTGGGALPQANPFQMHGGGPIHLPKNGTPPATTPPPMGTNPTTTPPPPPPGETALPQGRIGLLPVPPVSVGTLYVAETHTGRFAVYTMSFHPDPRVALVIMRNDATQFRPAPQQ